MYLFEERLKKDVSEALEAVKRINDEIDEAGIPKKGIYTIHQNKLNITISSLNFRIDFMVNHDDSYLIIDRFKDDDSYAKIPIYDSAKDYRIFDENTGEYESFYNYIKRKFNEIKTVINNVNL